MNRNPDADPYEVAARLDHGYTVKEFTAKLLRAGYTSEQLANLRLGRQGARNTKKKTAINGGEKAYILREKIFNSSQILSSNHGLIFNFISIRNCSEGLEGSTGEQGEELQSGGRRCESRHACRVEL